MRSPPYGFHLTPELHALLRSAPPGRALRWVEAAVGPGARVKRFRALPGGMSSALHAVDVGGHRLVLRRFVRADWLAEEPDAPAHEAIALAAVAVAVVPTPRLVAVDPTGADAGDPAILMTRVPGRVEWDPRDLDTFLGRLAEPLAAIHALEPDVRLPPYEPYSLHFTEPPGWSRRPEVWREAIELHLGPPPVRDDRLIHRDYHPGNLLWRRGRVTGVVDWVNASRGVPEVDVGHCRMNLAGRFGQAAADRFLALYQALTGRREYHPYWDVVAEIGGMDLEDLNPGSEAFIAAALARV